MTFAATCSGGSAEVAAVRSTTGGAFTVVSISGVAADVTTGVVSGGSTHATRHSANITHVSATAILCLITIVIGVSMEVYLS